MTRRDLPFEIASVQSAHAALEAGRTFLSPQDFHPFFCVCAVRDEARLRHDLDKLVKAGVKICAWYEPDLDNQLTAFASEPLSTPEQRHLFRNFQLLKFKEEIPHEQR